MSPRLAALLISGAGMILLGVSIWIIFPPYRPASTDFAAVPAPVSRPAPALELSDLHGQAHSLRNYQGQVVLVNLWATWCPPCKAELPILQAFFDRHSAQGFTVIAIDDGDPAADVLAFVDQFHLTFPVWLDPSFQAADRAFATQNLPSSYLIDRSGSIRFAWLGAISEPNLEKYVTPILQEP